MRYRDYVRRVLSALFLLALWCGPAAGQDLGEITGIYPETHRQNVPSRVPQIQMTWDIPEGDPYGYFFLFTTEPYYEFTWLNTIGMTPTRLTTCQSPNYAPSEPDDVGYYFHLAAIDGHGNIGETKTRGPFRIDVVPPKEAYIMTPPISPTRTVRLSIYAEGASEMYISNYAYERYGEWEQFFFGSKWELPGGAGEKTVYIRFRDRAGNTADASCTVNRILGDIDKDSRTGLEDAVSVMRILTGAYKGGINSDADVNEDGKIGPEEAVFILRKLSEEDPETGNGR